MFLLEITIPKENRIKSIVKVRKDKKALWFLIPTQLLIQGQWWSNRSTHTLQMAQCLDLGVLMTWQSGHKSVGVNFCISSKKSSWGSGLNFPGSKAVANIYERIRANERIPDGIAKFKWDSSKQND